MQYHVIQCNSMQYNAIPCNTMQYHAILCNTMQCHAIPCIINNCWRSVPLPCGQYNGHCYLDNRFTWSLWIPYRERVREDHRVKVDSNLANLKKKHQPFIFTSQGILLCLEWNPQAHHPDMLIFFTYCIFIKTCLVKRLTSLLLLQIV